MNLMDLVNIRRIISMMHKPAGFWAAFVIVLASSLTYAQTHSIQPQLMPQLPKVEPVSLQGIGQSQAPTEPIRYSISDDGYLVYLGAPPSYQFLARSATPGQPEVTARNFLSEHANSFGVFSAVVDFKLLKIRSTNNRHYLRFEQTYAGIPVFGAQVTIQLNAQEGIECVLSDIERNVKDLEAGTVSIVPLISAAEASQRARELFAIEAPGYEIQTTPPGLTLFAPSVVGDTGRIHLVWDMKVFSEGTSYVNERILLDAHTGEIVRRYPLNLPALYREIYDANNTTSDPGTLVRSEGGLATGIADVDNTYTYLGDTYNFYATQHSRDSIDGYGMPLKATVRYCKPFSDCPYKNAFWNNYYPKAIYFGDGYATDDITGHEYTHGVTDNESGLIYQNASGAINESFSDIWGEFIDLGNGQGNDADTVRWLIGEDIQTGAFRDMRTPPNKIRRWVTLSFPHPDRMSNLFTPAQLTVEDTSALGGDNDGICEPGEICFVFDDGGVHINSGINNKLCYLLTDGETFNGQTVAGMGISAVADLYYEVNTNLLTSGAGWTDLYNALVQAAVNLSWSSAERENLCRACIAVEIAFPGRNIYVDRASSCAPIGIQDCCGSVGPFTTVVGGVNAVLSGGTLFIRGGSYNESVIIDKSMKIMSYDGTVTIGQ